MAGELTKMKDIARKTVLQIYKEEGLDSALKVAQNIITGNKVISKEEGIDPKVRGQLKGELAEVVLESFLVDYVSKVPNTFVVKGLIVPFLGTKSGFTELDLTLFTPSAILFFEAKSYDGKCTLTDKCDLKSDKGSHTDVFAQSKLHLDALDSWIGPYVTTKKAYRLLLFSYADNVVEDLREDKYKKTIPFVDETNIETLIYSIKPDLGLVDIKKCYRVIKKMDAKRLKNTRKHLSGVMSK